MTNSIDNISQPTTYHGADNITVGNGQNLPIAHSGPGLLPTPTSKLSLSQIYHVPSISHNLLSVSSLTNDNNVSITFSPIGFTIKDLKTQSILLQGPCRNGLYTIKLPSATTAPSANAAISSSNRRWHLRLGHPHHQILHLIASQHSDLNISSTHTFCSICTASKSHKLPFLRSTNVTSAPLELLHLDVWGPSPTISNQGYRYFLLIIDDYSKYTWPFLMRAKSEVTHIVIHFKKFIEKQLNHNIKVLRTDGGSEFVNSAFQNFTQINGIHHQIACPYTPEQNGTAERKNRHLVETIRTLLHTAGLPSQFWPDALLTAAHLINRMPTPNLQNKSPFQCLHNRLPSYAYLKVFGCACYPWLPPSSRNKLQPRALPCIFLGYYDSYKGYKCLHLPSNKIFISRHVVFDEETFPYINLSNTTPSSSYSQPPAPNPQLLIPSSTLLPPQLSDSPTPCSPMATTPQPSTKSQPSIQYPSSRSNTSPPPVPEKHPMITRFKSGSLKPRTILNLLHTSHSKTAPDPTSFNEAIKIPHWRSAMATEFLALQKQGTWTLVPSPANANILGCRWLYRTKYHSNGTIARHKARLVAQGHRQEYGIDYHDTFSPVAKMPTIRVLLTIAMFHKWPVHQMDVSNAFLHGDLNETVYMTQPRGFEDNMHPTYVCLLKKAIYGLKQAPRQWFNTFSTYLLSHGFCHSQSDHSLLTLSSAQLQIYLVIYVDDILITGNNEAAVQKFILQISSQFTMKYLGHAHTFLGIQIQTFLDHYFLSQTSYALSILSQAGFQNCKPLSNPSSTKEITTPFSDPIIHNPLKYRQLTGSLQYLTITRPDLAYAVNVLCQHMHDPQQLHYHLLRRLLRYIHGTAHFGLPIYGDSLELSSFSDADWASDITTRRSTTGYCSFLGSTLVSWSVKK
ncbi:Retrovirus-related Pol polyprotein from transposon TNT 1-94 [Dendrobium catenatum]|uniref:Retrovirus-related Pol polyprotein from transposon TNT 1-94 n=1 Tax=Dendrobium catenatum TaxID=906689 RepID=A0A2I0VXC2_9ASPA|nr:Retrovirus-related Pol polyprotein from transposon TNT 1-94 [Dendrobium catenatum]